MGCGRENANIWRWLFGVKFRKYRRPFRQLIKSPYFWQDSFWTYWNRLIGCRFNHKDIHEGCHDESKTEGKGYCFACYREAY